MAKQAGALQHGLVHPLPPRTRHRVSIAGALWRLLLITFVLAGPAHAQPTLDTFNSQHYTVHTNLPWPQSKALAQHMDQVFDEYRRRFSGADFKPRAAGLMPLYLLDDRSDYIQLLGRAGINATNSSGMFFIQPNLRGLATWAGDRPTSETLSVLQHEGFHQFAYNYIGPDLPIWVNEGLAEYFEDGILVDGRMTLGLANAIRINSVQHALEDGTVVPFAALMGHTQTSWSDVLARDLRSASLLYDQSWSIVYFLIHADGQRYRQPFQRYLGLVATGMKSQPAFRRAFGAASYGPFRQRWEAFARQQQPDPMSTALTRMRFLGAGLAFLMERGERSPTSVRDLQQRLAAINFTLTLTTHGHQRTLRARDPELFTYQRDDGPPVSFRLLEAARFDQPKRVTAPGLTPEPVLVWSFDRRGNLVSDIAYP